MARPRGWPPVLGAPGGGIEPGETSRAAASRELSEETGLDSEIGLRSILVERDYLWSGRRHAHLEEFLRTDVGVSEITLASPTTQELTTFVDWHFFRPDELEHLDAPLEPPALATVLVALADDQVDDNPTRLIGST